MSGSSHGVASQVESRRAAIASTRIAPLRLSNTRVCVCTGWAGVGRRARSYLRKCAGATSMFCRSKGFAPHRYAPCAPAAAQHMTTHPLHVWRRLDGAAPSRSHPGPDSALPEGRRTRPGAEGVCCGQNDEGSEAKGGGAAGGERPLKRHPGGTRCHVRARRTAAPRAHSHHLPWCCWGLGIRQYDPAKNWYYSG
jgi:hypothetical protein